MPYYTYTIRNNVAARFIATKSFWLEWSGVHDPPGRKVQMGGFDDISRELGGPRVWGLAQGLGGFD